MPAALFIITPSIDNKTVNRLLLHLRDWEYGEEPTWDTFQIVTTNTLPNTDGVSGTVPTISENDLSNNIWANKSISDIESFILRERNRADKETKLNLSTITILDERGVKDGTIIVLDSAYNEVEEKMEDSFNKVRVPWEKAYIMWCNLDIGNMDFEDFVEDKEGNDEWSVYREDSPQTQALYDESAKKVKEKRQKAIVDLEKKGMA